ncbi:MAG: hypothetical protein HQM08_26360 [Candidatus Riflebacteria bacterium]|nr:hypothetical protein [Candidatus Riflebacteria bacterium]
MQVVMQEKWHTYWKNPGDSGMPPSINVILPDGFKAGEIQWPVPSRFSSGGEVTFGYQNEVLFLREISIPTNLQIRTPVSLKANISILLCEETCVPVQVSLEIILPVTDSVPQVDTRWEKLFAKNRKELPDSTSTWRFQARPMDERRIQIEITPPPQAVFPATMYFFPDQSSVVQINAPQILQSGGGGHGPSLIVERGFADPGPILSGVLVAPVDWK